MTMEFIVMGEWSLGQNESLQAGGGHTHSVSLCSLGRQSLVLGEHSARLIYPLGPHVTLDWEKSIWKNE